MAGKKKLQAVSNEKLDPDKDGDESGEEQESREQLLRARGGGEEEFALPGMQRGGHQQFQNGTSEAQTPPEASVVLDAETLGASAPVAQGRLEGVHLKGQVRKVEGARQRDKQNRIDFIDDDVGKADAGASIITLAGDQIGVGRDFQSITTFAGPKESSSIRKSNKNEPNSKINVKKNLKKEAKSGAAAPEGGGSSLPAQRAGAVNNKHDQALRAVSNNDDGIDLAIGKKDSAPAGERRKVVGALTQVQKILSNQVDEELSKTSSALQLQKWIMYQTQIKYIQHEEQELTSLKEVLKKRVQFCKDAQKFKANFEKRSIGTQERLQYKQKVVTLLPQNVVDPAIVDAVDIDADADDDKVKGSLYAQFNMMFEESVYKVRDENSFYVNGRHLRFSKNSLAVFDNKQKLRYAMVVLTTSKVFDRCVLGLILLNSLVLGIKDYTDANNTTKFNKYIEDLEPIFTYSFLFECMTKIVAQGFMSGTNSYLSDAWNWLDFTVVVASFLQQLPSMKNMSALRTFRLFRPLRSLTTMPSMRVLVGTLLASVISLGGIMALALFFFMIYAILGVSTWNGSVHYRCYETEWPLALPPYDTLSAAELLTTTQTVTFASWKLVPQDSHLCHSVERPCNRTERTKVFNHTAEDKKVISADVASTGTPPKRFLTGPALTGAETLSVGSLSEPVALPGNSQFHETIRKLWSKPSVDTSSSSSLFSAGDNSQAEKKVNRNAWSERPSLKNETSSEFETYHEGIPNPAPRHQRSMEAKDCLTGQQFDEATKSCIVTSPSTTTGDSTELGAAGNTTSNLNDTQAYYYTYAPVVGYCNSRYAAYDAAAHHYGISAESLDQDTAIAALNYGLSNFDDFFLALLTIFQCITMEGWTKIMNIYEDASSRLFVDLYFISCVVICSFFLLNLTIAVMLMKYEELDKAQKQSEHNKQLKDLGQDIKLPNALTEFLISQDSLQINKGAVKLLKVEDSFINQLLKPPKIVYEKNDLYYKKGVVQYCLKIIKNAYFDAFIILVIILNTITLTLDQYPENQQWVQDTLSIFNYVFTAIFTVEVVLKMVGMGGKIFMKDNYNRFDLFIVIISLLEIQVNSNTAGNENDGPGFVSSLRGFRLLKIFKLFRSGDLKILVDSITFTLTTIGDYVILLMLFVYVFALLGMSFFAGRIKFDVNGLCSVQQPGSYPEPIVFPVYEDRIAFEGEAPRTNFDELVWSVITIFQVLMGQGWNNIMYEAMRCVGPISALYFIALVIGGNIIMLNLFLAILLGNFDKARIFGQKKKVFEAFREIICEGKTLNESLDIILGEMSKHVKIKVLKWDKTEVDRLHQNGDSKLAQEMLMDGQRFVSIKSSINDNLTENRKPLSHCESVSFRSFQEPEQLAAEAENATAPEGDKVPSSEDQADEKQVAVRRLKKAMAASIQAKVDARVEMEAEHKRLIEMDKKNQRYAKTVEMFHRANPRIKRQREFAAQYHIEPWTGLREVMQRLPYPQSRQERRQSMANQMQRRGSASAEELEEGMQEGSNRDSQNQVSGSASAGLITPMSNQRNGVRVQELQGANRGDEKRQSAASNLLASFATSKSKKEAHEESDASEDNAKPQDEFDSLEPKTLAPLKEYFQNCSLYIFHKDLRLRRLCLLLSESADVLEELEEMEKKGTLGEYSERSEDGEQEVQYGQKKGSCLKRHPSKLFEDFILVTIILSTILLAVDNPLYDPNGRLRKVIGKIDYVFTAIFFFEFVIKIVAKGFYFNNMGPVVPYIKNSWNILDALVVFSSLIDVALLIFGLNVDAMKSLKAFRALRGLRPLRMISRDEGMRLVVNALLASLPSMTNVLLVCFLFILIFSIMGVSFFKGMFYRCVLDPKPDYSKEPRYNNASWVELNEISLMDIKDKVGCLDAEGLWENSNANFDNIVNAMLCLFQMMTTEGWVDVMYHGIDTNGIGKQPKKNANIYAIIFFLAFMIVGSQFIINLFVGVVIDNFNLIKEKEELGNMFVTEQQRSWIEIQKIGQSKKLRMKIVVPSGFQGKFFRLVNHHIFEYTITFFIVFNTICMALQSYRMNSSLENFTEQANYLFAFVFNVEMIFKLIGLRKIYFMQAWNIFDAFIVLATDTSIVLKMTASDSGVASTATVFRAFRIMRMFKLIRSSVHTRLILDTVFNILPQISNVMSLILLLFFIYAALGLNIFSGVRLQEHLDDKNNFQSFPNAMVMLMRFSTGEDWNSFMYELASIDSTRDPCSDTEDWDEIDRHQGVVNGCGTVLSYPFFLSFTVIVTMLIMNLSVAAVIEGLDTAKKENLGIVQGDEIELLIDYWQWYDPGATGWITMTDLVFLLYELPAPLGKRSSRINSNLAGESQESTKKTLRQQDRYLVNVEKRIIMKKIDALDLLRGLKIKVYSDVKRQINFVDVFKALTKRIFIDRQIDYKLSTNLSKKINKQWNKKHKDSEHARSTQYSAREQQAGSIITKWARQLLSRRKSNLGLQTTKKKKLTSKQQERQRAIDLKNKLSRKQQLQKQANIIQNIILNIPNIDSIESGEQKGGYAVNNEYEWKQTGGDKIIRHSPESYSLDIDSDEEERSESQQSGVLFEECNPEVQNNLGERVDVFEELQTEGHQLDCTKQSIMIDIFNLDDGRQDVNAKEVYTYKEGRKPKREDAMTEDAFKQADLARNKHAVNLEDPRYMPNEKYGREASVIHKTQLKQLALKKKGEKRELMASKRALPNFTRAERTFECGGNNDTITIDDRLLDAASYNDLMKKKKQAEVTKDDQLRVDLFLDDFDYEEERLRVNQPAREGLFHAHIADPALPARAYHNLRSSTPNVWPQHQHWMDTEKEVTRVATPSPQDAEEKQKMEVEMQKIGRIIGFKAKEEPITKVTTNNFVGKQ